MPRKTEGLTVGASVAVLRPGRIVADPHRVRKGAGDGGRILRVVRDPAEAVGRMPNSTRW
jgi:hypothetical protein